MCRQPDSDPAEWFPFSGKSHRLTLDGNVLDSVSEQETLLDSVGTVESTLAASQQADQSDWKQCLEDLIEAFTRWRDVSCAWLAMLPEHRYMEDIKNCILDEVEKLTMTFSMLRTFCRRPSLQKITD